MRKTMNALATSALVFAMAAPASAAVSENIVREIYLAAGGFKVRVHVKEDDTVILSGYVDDTYTKGRVEYVAKREGAKRVINRLFVE